MQINNLPQIFIMPGLVQALLITKVKFSWFTVSYLNTEIIVVQRYSAFILDESQICKKSH